jgi:hypothetical protein
VCAFGTKGRCTIVRYALYATTVVAYLQAALCERLASSDQAPFLENHSVNSRMVG